MKWQMGKLQMANSGRRRGRRGSGAAGSDLPFADLRFAISPRRRGFSLIEMLVALAITSALLSASLAALDTSFKSYQMTSQSSSTHVVTRIVMHRMLSMIRVGTEFGPFPEDVFEKTQNPVVMEMSAGGTENDETFIEFVSFHDPATGDRQITRLEVREPEVGATDDSLTLWLIIQEIDGATGVAGTPTEQPLLANVRGATFTLDYDVGPKLLKASIDL